jgi:dTDP-4-dehydrorhamnose reductase
MTSSMPKILVIGSSGQLASELKQLQAPFSDYQFLFTSQNDIDIADKKSVESVLKSFQPNFLINCAAYTAVDKAESDQTRAFDINEKGVHNLASLSKEHSCYLIHISTDFVFDGKKSSLYKEDDQTNPLSVYGLSKLKGEEAILASGCDYTIIRTSWLYSSFGNNFVKTMMRLGAEKESLNVVADQIGSPTYCADLALFILSQLENLSLHKKNIYHYSNEGVASWYDFAYEIMHMSELKCRVNPIPTIDYPTPAARPGFSVMDKTKIKNDFKINIPHWKESLAKCIHLLRP